MNNETQSPHPVGSSAVVRRRLIVDFFALGPISRWNVCEVGGWLTEADLAHHSGQERWAVAFKRAEERGELGKLRKLVDAETPNAELRHGGDDNE